MALPTPVLSDGDIVEVEGRSYESAVLNWDTWSQDPTKVAVLQAILYCLEEGYYPSEFRWIVSIGLSQNRVCLLHYSLLKGEELNLFRIPVKLITSSWPCAELLPFGWQLLVPSMINRNTVPGYVN